LDGFAINEEWVGPLKTGSLLTVGPLRIKIQLSDMAKDTPVPSTVKLPLRADEDEGALWRTKVYQTLSKEEKALLRRKQLEYKDRAEERRKRAKSEGGSLAIDALVNKFNHIVEGERAAEEAAESVVERPTLQAHRELNMSTDGTFLGSGGFERAGIGFQSEFGASLIPNVLDPKLLPSRDAKHIKTQMRYEQANR